MLGGLFVGLLALAAVMLGSVLGTVFFAVTIAYLLSPLHRRLRARGASPWVASALATTAAFLATLLLAVPVVVLVVLRLDTILAVLRAIPDVVTVEVAGFVYTITTQQAQALLVGALRSVARNVAAAIPVLLTKLALFAFLVFSLLHHQHQARQAVLAVVPPAYRSVVEALDRRARSTLFAIYVLQAATAAGTFLIALPVFYLLGYTFPFTLAVLAAILQFLPVVGPSLLLLALAVYHVAVGDLVAGVLIAFVGGFLIGWVPDLLIRPRLARETARLPASLYFVGFVGGLLTLGPIGVIAGPLVVALVAETASLLSTELNGVPVTER